MGSSADQSVQVSDIIIDTRKAKGVQVPLPAATLVLAVASAGFVMCGYLNLETADKFGDCAAVVKGVKTVEELLEARIVAVTSHAEKRGISIGMTGREALSRMF
jgi:uncharacterized protein YunC (DUF1805 family)